MSAAGQLARVVPLPGAASAPVRQGRRGSRRTAGVTHLQQPSSQAEAQRQAARSEAFAALLAARGDVHDATAALFELMRRQDAAEAHYIALRDGGTA